MDHIAGRLAQTARNIELDSADPIALHGFTQLPNFILRNPDLSVGAKTVYALFLSYAWHNDLCFPGQETLAKAIGMSVGSVNAFVKELEARGLIEITRRGQGKTNLYTIDFVVKPKPWCARAERERRSEGSRKNKCASVAVTKPVFQPRPRTPTQHLFLRVP